MNFQYNKIKSLFIVNTLCLAGVLQAQVAIGRANPRGILDVNNPNGYGNTTAIVLPREAQISDVTAPDGTDAIAGTFVYDISGQCARVKTTDGWTDCLLDGSGVQTVVSNVLSVGSNFKIERASLGYQHTLAIGKDDRAIYVAGDNSNGRTGVGRTSGNTQSFLLTFATPVADVSAGNQHSIAATAIGDVYTWGTNTGNYTGLGTTTGITALPNKVILFGDGTTFGKAIDVEAGSTNSYVLTESGKVYSVGTATASGTGSALAAFTQLNIVENIQSISASDASVAAVSVTGKVYVWGTGTAGRLGTGGTTAVSIPTLITTPLPVKKVAMGTTNGVAISQDGKHVYRWGNGGGVGNGGTNLLSPTEITIPNFNSATDEILDVAAQRFANGSGAMMVVTTKGVYVTGINSSGQLGTGTTTAIATGMVSVSTTSIFQGTTFTGAAMGRLNSMLFTGANPVNTSVSYVAYAMGDISYRQLGAITVQARIPTIITK